MNCRAILRLVVPSVLLPVLLVRLALGQDDAAKRFERLYEQAWTLEKAGRYQDMEKVAIELRQLAEGPLASRPRPLLARALSTLGVAYSNQARYAEAEPVYRQALEIDKKAYGEQDPSVAADLVNLAILLDHQARYTDAESCYNQALAIDKKHFGDQHPKVARDLTNLAILYRKQGRYTEAEPVYKQALEIDKKEFGEQHQKVAAALANLANLYGDHERYAEAEPLYRQALEVFRKTLGERHPNVAKVLGNMGSHCSQQGRYAEAEPILKQALEISKTTFGPHHPEFAANLRRLAIHYQRQGRHSEAEPLQIQALEIDQKVFGKQHPKVAGHLNNLAILYLEQGRYAEAERLATQSLETYRKAFGDRHPVVGRQSCSLALMYASRRRYAEAKPLAEQAVGLLERPDVGAAARRAAYYVRAEVRWALGQRNEALADLRHAMDLAEEVRAKASGGEIERATAFEQVSYVFDLMVAWQTELGGREEALEAMERSRARTLLDQMELQGLDLLAGLPKDQQEQLRRQELAAQGRVSELRKQLELLPGRRDLSAPERRQREEELAARLGEAQREAAQAYANVRNASPAYRLAVGRDRKPATLKTLHEYAKKHQALVLEYLIGKNGAYLLVVPCDGKPRLLEITIEANQGTALETKPGALTTAVLQRVLSSEKGSLLARLRRCTGPEQERELAQALAALWKVLIPEAERKALVGGQYRRLIVLPDGPLARLPFEVLVVQPGDQPRYLLDVGPVIEYAPSATILINLAERNFGSVGQAKERILTVGDCRYKEPGGTEPDALLAQLTTRSRYRGAGGGLTPLYFSGKEMSWVSHNFDRHGLPVAALKGATATEKNFHMAVPGRRVVHLACHGLVDEAYGNLFGALALTPGPDANDPADDGFLTVAEVYGLDLQACELVILSACDSNVGPQQRGEGVWALSRGFLVAGARRVVASNWLVDDEAAASLISHFCGGLALSAGQRARPDYGQCLYEAKRWVRQQEKWSSPYYWGTFVLIGPQ